MLPCGSLMPAKKHSAAASGAKAGSGAERSAGPMSAEAPVAASKSALSKDLWESAAVEAVHEKEIPMVTTG